MSSRREFIVGCSSAIAAMAGARFGSLSFAEDQSAHGNKILVALFLRGGMDGLNVIAPVDDQDYMAARLPGTRISDSGAQAGLSLSNAYAGHDFRLHPQAVALKELYDSKDLSFVHAAGNTNATRSHFEAQDLIELGIADPKDRRLNSGWLGRLIAASHPQDGLVPAVTIGGSVDKSLFGYSNAAAIPNPGDFNFMGSPDQKKALESFYEGRAFLQAAGAQTLQTIDEIQKSIAASGEPVTKGPGRGKGAGVPGYVPSPGVKYSNLPLDRTMQSLAQLIKLDVGLQFATVDFGGWDTHVAEGQIFGRQISELGNSLNSFWNDISAYHDRVTVVVMSEFGRRVKENQSGGTDHGHGNLMMALGAHVNGGMMHGAWPGLAVEQLDQRADLAVTTDYRRILAELAKAKYGVNDASSLFPGLTNTASVGLFS